MIRILFFSLAILLSITGFGQDYQTQFQNAFQENDTLAQLEALQAWEQAKPKDAELFTSYFNYYVNLGKKELIALTDEQSEGDHLVITDSLNNTVGYLGSRIYYDEGLIEKGIAKINEGIGLHPNRLDMRFGKIYVFGLIEDWERFTDEIIQTISFSHENDNLWTWTNNQPLDNGEEFFVSNLQDYQVQLYNTGEDSLLINMRNIAQKVLEFYPDHVESLSNLAVTYLITEEYDKAISALLKAEEINPQDYIVLSNIAQGYKLKGDKARAIEYYEKTIEYGDEQAVEYARQQIDELKE